MSAKVIRVSKNYCAIIDYDIDLSGFHFQMNGNGYVQIVKYLGRENGKMLREVNYLHRFILGFVKGDKIEIDHINRDRLDNRRDNLRVCSHAENQRNNGGKGAYRQSNGKWMAYGRLNNKMKNLGLYSSEKEAVEVANLFKIKNFGAFANPFHLDMPATP